MPAFTRSDLADLNVFMTIVRRRSFRQAALERSPLQGSATHLLFLESTIVRQSDITYFASTKRL